MKDIELDVAIEPALESDLMIHRTWPTPDSGGVGPEDRDLFLNLRLALDRACVDASIDHHPCWCGCSTPPIYRHLSRALHAVHEDEEDLS